MALIHQGTWATLQALDIADLSNGNTAQIYYNSRTRTFTFNSTSTEAENNTRPGPYYLRPHDYASAGVWEETIGNDYDVFNAGQIVGSVLQSSNWGTTAGSQFDLDAGKIEIRQSGGGITIKAGGDLVFKETSTIDPSLLILNGHRTVESRAARLIFQDPITTTKYFQSFIYNQSKLYLCCPSAALTTAHIELGYGPTDGPVQRTTMWGGNCYVEANGVDGAVYLTNGTGILTVVNTVGIGTASPSANADLTLEGGALCLNEMSTPTADTNYGKVYTKADNKLYFQDGAGSEHTIAFV